MGVENDKKDFDLAYVTQHITLRFSLKDLLGTVKVATLIFISGRGSIISTAREWKSGSIHWLSV